MPDFPSECAPAGLREDITTWTVTTPEGQAVGRGIGDIEKARAIAAAYVADIMHPSTCIITEVRYVTFTERVEVERIVRDDITEAPP